MGDKNKVVLQRTVKLEVQTVPAGKQPCKWERHEQEQKWNDEAERESWGWEYELTSRIVAEYSASVFPCLIMPPAKPELCSGCAHLSPSQPGYCREQAFNSPQRPLPEGHTDGIRHSWSRGTWANGKSTWWQCRVYTLLWSPISHLLHKPLCSRCARAL